jgi:hypothetical protein
MDTDRDDLIAKLNTVKPKLEQILRAQGAHEPDWEPLERVLPFESCGGFMFMGNSGVIRLYKHGLTRRNLNLDPQGNAYRYDWRIERYLPQPLSVALDVAFEGIEQMGYTRETPYDDEVRAERAKALADAGWTTVTVSPELDEA